MFYFIVNPNAGGAKGFETWKAAEARLQKLKVEYKSFVTDGHGDAIRIAREITCSDDARQKDNIVIVPVGGDGTFNEVLNGININSGVSLGYIPTGSGNDLARGLGLHTNVVKCVDNIVAMNNIIEMDYGILSFGENEVTNRRFAVSCGIGYDAGVCETMDRLGMKHTLSKIKLQKQAYIMLGAVDILRTKPVKGYVIIDNERRVEFNDIIFISVHNHVTEGGGKKFAPQADYQDGILNVCVMHTKSKVHFAALLAKGIGGNHPKEQGVRLFDCKSIRIHSETPMAVHTDGELFEHQTDIEVACVERKLRIIV